MKNKKLYALFFCMALFFSTNGIKSMSQEPVYKPTPFQKAVGELVAMAKHPKHFALKLIKELNDKKITGVEARNNAVVQKLEEYWTTITQNLKSKEETPKDHQLVKEQIQKALTFISKNPEIDFLDYLAPPTVRI